VIVRASRRKTDGSSRDGLAKLCAHRRDVVFTCGQPLDAALPHDVDAQGIVRHLQRKVDAMRLRIEGIHVLGKALPVPANALGQRRAGDVLDALHQRYQRLAIDAATGGKANAAVAAYHRRDAMR
jgi:hypothetical protein